MRVGFKSLIDSRNTRLVFCSIVYQVIWFVGVFAAVRPEKTWLPPLAVAACLFCQLSLWPALRRRTLVLLLTALCIGFVMDSLMSFAGVFELARIIMPWPLTPVWLLSLWAGFGVYIGLGLDRLYGRWIIPALGGFFGGPLAYRAGVPFGAVSLGQPAWQSLLVIAVAWALVFPFLIWLAGRLQRAFQSVNNVKTTAGAKACGIGGMLAVCSFFMIGESEALALDGDYKAFETTLYIQGEKLSRRGVGRLRKFFITGCDIALYADPTATTENLLGTNSPVALEFFYYTKITAHQFASSADEILRKNIDENIYKIFQTDIERIGKAYQDVKSGDRYLFYFIPGYGTALDLNGARIILIEGDEFAQYYLRIWLGDEPLDKRLYEGMTKNMTPKKPEGAF